MNIKEFFTSFSGGATTRPATSNPAPMPKPQPQTLRMPARRVGEYNALMASKAMRQLRVIDQSRNFKLFSSDKEYEDLVHDVGVMLEYQDLDGVSLQALDKEKKVIFEFKIAFAVNGANGKKRDASGGIEIPLLDPSSVAGARWLLHRKGKEPEYKHQLRLSYGAAAKRDYADDSSFNSDHAAAITGGRQTGRVRVANQNRMPLTVVRVGGRGFAFAQDAAGKLQVFCHASEAPTDHSFSVGQKITAVVVQVPKGLQARQIRPAP
jgi:cold shock CspA family protein